LQNKVTTPDLASICSHGLTPLGMSGILRRVLISHFSEPKQLISPYLRKVFADGGYAEEASETTGYKSPIYIETLDRWRPTHSEERPSLVIKDADWQFTPLSINNIVNTDVRSGQQTFAGLWSGGHVVFAVGSESALAKILGMEVAKLLMWSAQTMLPAFNLIQFRVQKLGATVRLRESHTSYLTPIEVGYILDEAWQTQVEAPRLKQIRFKASDISPNY
jgi:hypothetical protein